MDLAPDRESDCRQKQKRGVSKKGDAQPAQQLFSPSKMVNYSLMIFHFWQLKRRRILLTVALSVDKTFQKTSHASLSVT